jgi:hypothetical protein
MGHRRLAKTAPPTLALGGDLRRSRIAIIVDNRAKTFEAESGMGSITNWYRSRQANVARCLQECSVEQWRTLPNGFRSGGIGGDGFVWDKHHLHMAGSRRALHSTWATAADTLTV